MKDQLLVAGSGALNLDLIYEVDSLHGLSAGGRSLEPGRELKGSRAEALDLMEQLERQGRLVAREGGGSCANTLTILARLGRRAGIRCAFIGSAGSDEEGDMILGSMEGVDTSGVVRRGRSSICIVVLDRKTRDRAMFVSPGDTVLDVDSPKVRGIMEDASLFHFSSLAVDQGVQLQLGLLDLAGPETMISSDPGEIYAGQGLASVGSLLARCHLLFVTDFEADMLFGKGAKMSRILGLLNACSGSGPLWKRISLAPPVLVKKSGSRGAGLASRSQELFMPAGRVEHVVDNTGAGDAFDAGFLMGFILGCSAGQCLEMGHMVAAESLTGYGRQWFSRLDALYEKIEKRGLS